MFWTVLHIVGYPAQPLPLTGCSNQGVFKQPRRDSTILKRTAVRENTKQTWCSSNCQSWRPFWANVLFVCGSNSQQKTWKADRPTNHWVNRIKREVSFYPRFLAQTTYNCGLEFSSLSFSFESFPFLLSSCHRLKDSPRVLLEKKQCGLAEEFVLKPPASAILTFLGAISCGPQQRSMPGDAKHSGCASASAWAWPGVYMHCSVHSCIPPTSGKLLSLEKWWGWRGVPVEWRAKRKKKECSSRMREGEGERGIKSQWKQESEKDWIEISYTWGCPYGLAPRSFLPPDFSTDSSYNSQCWLQEIRIRSSSDLPTTLQDWITT